MGDQSSVVTSLNFKSMSSHKKPFIRDSTYGKKLEMAKALEQKRKDRLSVEAQTNTNHSLKNLQT